MMPDTFGHCIRCHRNLILEKVINNEWKKVLAPDYSQVQVELDDGSKMRVVMCLGCQESYEDKHHDNMMKAVILGWQNEIDNNPLWNDDMKKNYMKRYGKLKIKSKVKDYKFERERVK